MWLPLRLAGESGREGHVPPASRGQISASWVVWLPSRLAQHRLCGCFAPRRWLWSLTARREGYVPPARCVQICGFPGCVAAFAPLPAPVAWLPLRLAGGCGRYLRGEQPNLLQAAPGDFHRERAGASVGRVAARSRCVGTALAVRIAIVRVPPHPYLGAPVGLRLADRLPGLQRFCGLLGCVAASRLAQHRLCGCLCASPMIVVA